MKTSSSPRLGFRDLLWNLFKYIMVWHINALKALINVPNQTLFIEIFEEIWLANFYEKKKKKCSLIT